MLTLDLFVNCPAMNYDEFEEVGRLFQEKLAFHCLGRNDVLFHCII